MSKEYQLKMPEILQADCYSDTNEMCGAACAQMVLHDIKPGGAITPGEQHALYAQITAPPPTTSIWYNPPQGIERVLNKAKLPRRLDRGRATLSPDLQAVFGSVPAAPATTYQFAILGDSSPVNDPGIRRGRSTRNQIAQIELLSRLLIRTVAINGAAPIVAVHEDNAHWIVVNGFQIRDDYNDANLSQRSKIEAILIRNPLGRYTYRTTTCDWRLEQKLEEITGHECKDNPYVQDIVAYDTWVREYMFSDWAESFVAVCDSSAQIAENILTQIKSFSVSEPPKLSSVTTERGSRNLDVMSQQSDPQAKEITPKEAIAQAERAIKNFNLSQLNQSVTPQNTLDPVKVKRLDRIDGDYYLVPAGVGNKISALINISLTGEFNEATVWPNGKYIAPFDQHPEFISLTSGQDSRLRGRKIRHPVHGSLTIRSVSRDLTTPYVWRPSHESFSSFRPFHNLELTVQERGTPISFYFPIDDYCLGDDNRDISLPSANYLELVTDCIKQRAVNITSEVLVVPNRRGNTVLVMYQSNQTQPIEELEVMRRTICQCLKAHPSAELTRFCIKAFKTNAFLTNDLNAFLLKRRGGGDDAPLGSAPAPGAGEDEKEYQISSCSCS